MRRNEQRDEGIYGPYPRRLREVQHVADTRERGENNADRRGSEISGRTRNGTVSRVHGNCV